MRCAAYCTASSYDLQGLLNNLLGGSSSTLYEGSLHFRIRDGDVFFFSFGSVVFWNFSEIEEHEILKKGKVFEKDSLLRMEFDRVTMFNKDISMDDVRFALEKNFSEDIHLIYSDYNSEKLIMRIRLALDQKDSTKDDILNFKKSQ